MGKDIVEIVDELIEACAIQNNIINKLITLLLQHVSQDEIDRIINEQGGEAGDYNAEKTCEAD